jgi:DNA-binding Lrp family transcriptional regulator
VNTDNVATFSDIDRINREILATLRSEGRTTFTELAGKVRLSRVASEACVNWRQAV